LAKWWYDDVPCLAGSSFLSSTLNFEIMLNWYKKYLKPQSSLHII
jgi:hypothetical protein